MARLYADEDFPFPVVERLRQLGHDVLTTLEAGRANQRIADAAHHAGIISVTDDPDFDGQASRIDNALAGCSTLADQHVRVNRPNPSAKP